jgi:alpha-L-rhamnosidase
MNSHNHPAFGFVGEWFFRALAGITPEAAHGGYKHFDIKPQVVGELTEARASVDTVRGPVASHWKRSKDAITLDVTIPANSHASVWVPKVGLSSFEIRESSRLVWANGKLVPGVPGIDSASDAGDWIKFEVGSGTYSFKLTKR